MKSLFDDVLDYENQLTKDKENRDIQDALGKARVVYEHSTEYTEETEADQIGAAMPTEAESAEEEHTLDASAAELIEQQIADQRAAEQAAINAAVEAANAEVEAAREAAEE